MKILEDFVTALPTLAMRTIMETLPWRACDPVGAFLGRAAYAVEGNKRKIALSNLRFVFGEELPEDRIRKIALTSFEGMGQMFCETIVSPKLGGSKLKKIMPVTGEEHLSKALSAGRGVVGFSAHLGNFALIGPRLAAAGHPFNYIIKFPHSRHVSIHRKSSEKLISFLADRLGVGLIPSNNVVQSIRQSIARLKQNEIVCILGDQKKVDGLWIDFFGKKAGTAQGPVVLALKTGAPIIPMFAFRSDNGSQSLVIKPEFKLEVSGDFDRDVLLNTTRLTQMLEKLVSENPEQWWWLQRRWKPPDASSGKARCFSTPIPPKAAAEPADSSAPRTE